MNSKNQQKKIVEALKTFAELKGITKDEIKILLKESFIKSLQKEYEKDFLEEEILLPIFELEINLENGKLDINRKWLVSEAKDISEKEIHQKISLDDEKLKGSDLKVGDSFFENIDFNNITQSNFFQYIKQLFTQKVSEAEKNKIYEKFSNYKDKILKAKVERVAFNHYLLNYEGNTIFLSKKETSKLDQFNFGDFVYVYISKIEKSSKDAQIIATRRNPEFIIELLKKEIDDVADNVIKVEKIARQPGLKTKIIVSTTIEEVDPMGSIIGVKGKKIKPIVDELRGERIDVIKYDKNINLQIAYAVIPGKIVGIKRVTDEHYILITEENEFLSVLGKRGLNIKLVANLVGKKLDVKTEKKAQEEGVEYDRIVIPKRNSFQALNKDFSRIVINDNNDENYDLLEDLERFDEADEDYFDQELDRRY